MCSPSRNAQAAPTTTRVQQQKNHSTVEALGSSPSLEDQAVAMAFRATRLQAIHMAHQHSNRWTIHITLQKSSITRKGVRGKLANSIQIVRIQITKLTLLQLNIQRPTLRTIVAILTVSPIPLLNKVTQLSDSRRQHHLSTMSPSDTTVRRQKE